jgi:hypothetical protein
MSQGNSRTNGISDRESSSQPKWEDDHQNIGHRPLATLNEPPQQAANGCGFYFFCRLLRFLDRLDSNSENS